MYYVYILRCKDKSFYTGITTDVDRRFKEHRAGTGGRYTRSHKPERILYREGVATRSDALKREAEIKKWPREKKLQLIRRQDYRPKSALTNSSAPLPVFEE